MANNEWVQDDRTFRHTSGALIRAVGGGWYWWSAADARADVEFVLSEIVQTRAEAELLALGIAADDGPGEGWVQDGNRWVHQASGARVGQWRAGWRWAANATAAYSSMAHSRREAERLAIAMAVGENDGSREGWTLRMYSRGRPRGGMVGAPVPTRHEAERLAIEAAQRIAVVAETEQAPVQERVSTASGAVLDAIGRNELHTVRAGTDDSDEEFREQLLRALWPRGSEQAMAFLLALERLVRANRYRGNAPIERRRQ